jgi:hypothetical protein
MTKMMRKARDNRYVTTTTLRNGAQVEDRRLDRIYPGVEEHFPSLAFLTAENPRLEGKAPRSYTHNFRVYDPHLDQGSEGACVGFGWAHELACTPGVVKGVDNQFARERIYWAAQRRDQWDGGAYPGASPFMEGSSVLAGAQVVKDEIKLIGGYDWSLTLDELIMAVGYLGPAVMGTDWYSNMFSPDAAGFVHATGSIEGGHCWLARGVSLRKLAFRCRNSWGIDWGEGGDFWVSFDDIGKLLDAQGEACVPRLRKVA